MSSNLFFSADLHFNHANIMKYCHRPFASVDEMNETMIENWNRVVGQNSAVYVAGDFMFSKSSEEVEKIIKRLNGKIHLILGNHDKQPVKKAKGFASINDYLKIQFNNQKVILSHYAFRVWDCKHFGSYHLYGHSHGTLPDDNTSLSFDIGVDCWNFTPVSYEQVEEKMKTKSPTSLIKGKFDL